MASDKYMNLNVWWFKLLGYNKLETNTRLSIRFLHSTLRAACNIFTSSMIILSIVGVLKMENIEFNTLNIAVYIGGIYRINYQYIFDDEAENIVQTMNKLFKSRSLTGMTEKDMRRHKRTCDMMTMVGLILDGIACLSFVFLSLLNKSERTLPFPLWYPYDWKSSPYYEITFTTQIISQCIMGLTYFNSDIFFITALFLTTGQFEILGWEIRNLFSKVLLQNGATQAEIKKFQCRLKRSQNIYHSIPTIDEDKPYTEISGILETEKFSNDLHNGLNDLVRFHQKLLSFCDRLEDFFSPTLLFTLPNTILYTIFAGFIFVTTENASLRIPLAQYVFTSLFQVFWPTFFGHLLNHQCAQLRNDLYEFPWYLCNKKFNENLRFVHLRTTKPCAITIGKFCELNLTIYLWVVKTSFSYLTVLRKVTEKY